MISTIVRLFATADQAPPEPGRPVPIEPLPPAPTTPSPLPQPPVTQPAPDDDLSIPACLRRDSPPAESPPDDVTVDKLRKRAAAAGYKLALRKRGAEFLLLDKHGRTVTGGEIGGLSGLLDEKEGKVAILYTRACGQPIPGMTNEGAIKERAKRCGFRLRSGAGGFDLIKDGAVRHHAETLAEVVKLLDDAEPVGGTA